MLALCQHNAATYYAQNYAGIIGASLLHGEPTALNKTLQLYYIQLFRI